MSSVSQHVMEPSAPTLDRAALRRRIDSALLTESDLDAFCVDYFPDVYRRFGRGWDRVARVSLLLELAAPAVLSARLQELSEARFPSQDSASATPLAPHARGPRGLSWGLACAGLVCSTAIGVWVGGLFLPQVPSTVRLPPAPALAADSTSDALAPPRAGLPGPAGASEGRAKGHKPAVAPRSQATEPATHSQAEAAARQGPAGVAPAAAPPSPPVSAPSRGSTSVHVISGSPGAVMTIRNEVVTGR